MTQFGVSLRVFIYKRFISDGEIGAKEGMKRNTLVSKNLEKHF